MCHAVRQHNVCTHVGRQGETPVCFKLTPFACLKYSAWKAFRMQVSGANDYRLRDHVLERVLAAPVTQSVEIQAHQAQQAQQAQQGAMMVGPGRHEALAASWSQTAGPLSTNVSIVCCSEDQTTNHRLLLTFTVQGRLEAAVKCTEGPFL